MPHKKLIFRITPGGSVKGNIRVPGDKSISHRAIMLGAIAEGDTQVDGFLKSEDSLATLAAFQAMGVEIKQLTQDKLLIHGVGLQGLKAPNMPLDLGNSGTSIRLLTGLLAGQSFDTELTGDNSLQKRPMLRVVEPLATMGASIKLQDKGTAPLFIQGNQKLYAIRYQMTIASAQVKSALLLASLYADGETTIIEPTLTRDHTERMLQAFSYPVRRDGHTVRLQSGHKLIATHLHIPADISSAAFFMVAASITPGSDIILQKVGLNQTRTGVINILSLMGADIRIENEQFLGEEPVADIRVRYSALTGIDIPLEQVSLAIDEFPVLFIAAACAKGITTLRGAKELRVKESDRILAMADGLHTLGIKNKPSPDGIVIEGGRLQGGWVNSHGDHRVAMAFVIAGLVAADEINIDDCANVATSFPNFISLAQQVGINVSSIL